MLGKLNCRLGLLPSPYCGSSIDYVVKLCKEMKFAALNPKVSNSKKQQACRNECATVMCRRSSYIKTACVIGNVFVLLKTQTGHAAQLCKFKEHCTTTVTVKAIVGRFCFKKQLFLHVFQCHIYLPP